MNKLPIEVYDGQVERNFNIAEFRCKDNGEVLLNKKVLEHIEQLQRFRTWYNRPMIIVSGYRTLEYNRSIGSNDTSQHVLGVASDIRYPDEFYAFTPERKKEFLNNIKNKWNKLCKEKGIRGGVGFYDTFFHLDSREGNESMAFWDLRSK